MTSELRRRGCRPRRMPKLYWRINERIWQAINSKPKERNIMKKMKHMLIAIMTSATLLFTPVVPLALVGCSGGCSTVAEGHDPVVVRAEQVAAGAYELMDAFVAMEENNRAYLRT